MALDPQSKDLLAKYTRVAKEIVYRPEFMKKFLAMMGTPEGAITAVQTVIAVIEKNRPVPPNIQPVLGVNTYLAMVDVAQEAKGIKADAGIMKKVIQAIMAALSQPAQNQPDEAQQPMQPQPQGLMASMQGVPA